MKTAQDYEDEEEAKTDIYAALMQETVDHPQHYNKNPSGTECIDIVEWMTFNQGNAVKYLWRMFDKGDPIENLDKAIWYCQREKERIETIRAEENEK